MMTTTAILPDLLASTGIGTLLGPITILALAAVLVTLGVLVAGLALEPGDAGARRRMTATSTRPEPTRVFDAAA